MDQGASDPVIEQIGIFPPGSEQRVGRRLSRRFCPALFLVQFLKQQGRGSGHSVIDRREMPIVDGGLDRAFDNFW